MPKKKPGQLSLFPEAQYEYHILLSPPENIQNDIAKLRETLNGIARHGTHNSIPAHLTLHTLEAAESVSIKELMNTALAGQRKFTIKIKGCEQRENTLALKIENPGPVAALAALVKAPHKAPAKTERQTSILDKPKRAPKINFSPNITIARKIAAEDLECITDHPVFDYRTEWLCDRVVLVRRKTGEEKLKKYAEIKLRG